MDIPSGFFYPPAAAADEVITLELIYSSQCGWCELYRGNKEGRFRIYKCLQPRFRGDATYERLLRKEFEIGYSLSHINICEYYSFLTLPELGNAIEMEWIDGESLDALLDAGKIDARSSGKIISELCDALSYMHSKQVIHRDLKPSNIVITHNGGNVKVIDFGLSDSDSYYVLKEPAGTKVYAAPEVLNGEDADSRADIYSLGAVIARLPGKYRKIAAKCCRPKPSDRYQSAAEVKAALAAKPRWWIPVLALLALALLVVWLLRPKAPESAPQPIPERVRDTIVVMSQPSAPTPAPVQKQAPASSPQKEVNADDIDALVREATDLFD